MIDYHIDVARRIVTTRVTGRLSLADLAGHLQRIVRDPKFSADFNALIVAMDATAVPTDTSVALLAPLVRAWSLRRTGVKWAFVLPDATSKAQAESGLLRLKLTSVSTRCFRSENAALAWLEPVPAKG
jgi:hypothetical protein